MLISGSPSTTELLDFTSNSNCEVPFETFANGIGGQLEGKIIICSKYNWSCNITPLDNLQITSNVGPIKNGEQKHLSSAIATIIDIGTAKNSGLWIANPTKSYPPDIITSTEIIQTSELDKNMKYAGGCVLKINSTTIMVIGGNLGYKKYARKDTWFGHYNEDPWKWTQGPDLLLGRYNQGCALLTMKSVDYIVVVGGNYKFGQYGPLTTVAVEWMETTSTSWSKGIIWKRNVLR